MTDQKSSDFVVLRTCLDDSFHEQVLKVRLILEILLNLKLLRFRNRILLHFNDYNYNTVFLVLLSIYLVSVKVLRGLQII